MQTKDFIFYEKGKMKEEFLIKELDRALKDFNKNEDIEIYEAKIKRIKGDFLKSHSDEREMTMEAVMVKAVLDPMKEQEIEDETKFN
jgi:hypothetical protein